jgi:hypothetical protein
MRSAQYRDLIAGRSRPCPRGQAEAGTTPPGTARVRAARRCPGPLAEPGHACARSHPMTASLPQRQSQQVAPPAPRRRAHAGRAHQGHARRLASGRPAARRLQAQSTARPQHTMSRIPSNAKARQRTPALKGYHISPGSFTRLFSARLRGRPLQHSEREGGPPHSEAGRPSVGWLRP